MSQAISTELVSELQAFAEPQDLLREIFTRFGDRAAIGTSGQLTGVVLIDLAVRAGLKPRVFTIDTERLFPETYELFEAVENKYGLGVERVRPEPAKIQNMVREHGEYLFFDSKEKQELCCRLRKVEPNERVLDTLDVWITGLRSDQSSRRAETLKFQIITHGASKRPILKIAPLVDWTEEKLRDYAARWEVPVHRLLNGKQDGWYYESLGCAICTTPIGPHEARRAGRWRWFNAQDGDKECGLHRVKPDEI